MALDQKDLVVEVSSDRMEASIKFTNPDTLESVTKDLVIGALRQKSVVEGLLLDTIENIAASPVVNTSFLVAKGKLAEPGKDEVIEYKFPITSGLIIQEEDSGSIDFHKISNFNNFNEGDVLALRVPAIDGENGFNVSGDVLPFKVGKSVVLRVGKGAEFKEHDQAVVALVPGHGCIVNDRVSVLNTVEIPGHVDYSVGNIDFIGNLKIRGGVMPGFEVKAAGNIEITDNVEKASIDCGGDLKIQGIIFGHNDCNITVKGDAEINAIDQAKLDVMGKLIVHGYIRHCTVRVGDYVELQGAKGSIVGGEVATLTKIKAPFIGNNMATLTKLSVGSNPFATSDMDATTKNHNALSEKLGQVNTALNTLRNKMTQAGPAGSKMQPMLDKLKQAKSQLEPAVTELAAKLEKLKTSTMNFKEAKIQIAEKVFPGVVVNFRNKLQYKTMDEAQHLTFFEEGAEIRTGPL